MPTVGVRVSVPVLEVQGISDPSKVAATEQLLAGNRLVSVTIVLSQPNWLGRILVVLPTCAGSQVVRLRLVILPGNKVLVSVTILSQPN